jgi:hypothetical protein
VEFARKSATRGGAPTLIPVTTDGEHVPAHIIVMKDSVSRDEACDLIWRRETRQMGSGKRYVYRDHPWENATVVRDAGKIQGIDLVLYTEIGPNIRPLAAKVLARLAVQSVGQAPRGRDGICYLMSALSRGVKTPLSGPYEAEIKRLTGTASLNDALHKLESLRRATQST